MVSFPGGTKQGSNLQPVGVCLWLLNISAQVLLVAIEPRSQKYILQFTGHISPWRLAQLFETGRALAHYADGFFTSGLMRMGYTFFTVVIYYDIKPRLYRLTNDQPLQKSGTKQPVYCFIEFPYILKLFNMISLGNHHLLVSRPYWIGQFSHNIHHINVIWSHDMITCDMLPKTQRACQRLVKDSCTFKNFSITAIQYFPAMTCGVGLWFL